MEEKIILKKLNRMYNLYKMGAEALRVDEDLFKEFLALDNELENSEHFDALSCAMSMRDQILHPELYVEE